MRERCHLDDLSIDGNLVLKLIIEEWVGRVWMGLM
jgi:hypothetical protein